MAPQRMPLRSPTLPSAFGRNLGTRNNEMPLVPPARPAGAPARGGGCSREVVLAGRNEDLGAADRVAAVGLRLALVRSMPRSVRNGVRSGTSCRSSCRRRAWQVGLLERIRAVARQRLVGAVAQPGIHGEGLVRRGEHLLQREAHGRRQALAAILGIQVTAVQPPSRTCRRRA